MAVLTSKQKLFKSLTDNGWTLDTRNLVPKSRYADERVQGRNVYLRDATHGGQWRVRLHWTNRGSTWHGTEGDRLMRVSVTYAPADTVYEATSSGRDGTSYVDIGDLKNTEREINSYWQSDLWNALKWNGKDDTVGTLLQAVDLLVKDPDYAIWLVFVARHERKVADGEAARKAKELAEAKARKLPVTVSQAGYEWESTNEWAKLTRKLKSAAGAIESANGLSDLPQLMADMHDALKAVTGALDPEALQALGNLLNLLDTDNLVRI